jgi:hypothetical protein
MIEFVQSKYGVPGSAGYVSIDPKIYPDGRITQVP